MPQLPAEITQPFGSRQERAAERELLLRRDRGLRAVERLTQVPENDWPDAERNAIPTSIDGLPEPRTTRVSRWASIFADELAAVHELVDGGRPLGDVELREASYLAGRLLSTVTGRPLEEIDRSPYGG